MTVAELIAKLNELPQDYRVEALHAERFCDDPVDISSEEVESIKILADSRSVFLSTRLP
jgi:hypothetical protein